MNAGIVAVIVVASVAAYLVAGFYTGRWAARLVWATDPEGCREDNAIMVFWPTSILWPVMLPILVASIPLRCRCWRQPLAARLFPEVRREQHELSVRKMKDDIDRLHREIGAAPIREEQ